jgi:hypothetical protein
MGGSVGRDKTPADWTRPPAGGAGTKELLAADRGTAAASAPKVPPLALLRPRPTMEGPNRFGAPAGAEAASVFRVVNGFVGIFSTKATNQKTV